MLNNSVESLTSVETKPTICTPTVCTLCGLMCDLGNSSIDHCDRRKRWMEVLPSRGREPVELELTQRLKQVELDARTLIWLDACDVQTTRAAVQLARRLGATVHVGQSTGSHAVKKVMTSGGWLGTTLSEISARADLVISIGDGIRREAPLLAERFFHSTSQEKPPYWIHISQHGSAGAAIENSNVIAPHEVIHWPRDQWFDSLSQLALMLLQSSDRAFASADSAIKKLSDRLLAAKQAVWVWDVDELHFQSDELLVRRMLSIAEVLSERMRCALLPLDLNVGRVTAEETLLWLTGCPATATWNGTHWYRSPRYADYSLEQWSSSFSSIVLVSSLASDRSLPNLPADITIQTVSSKHEREFQVAAVGRDCSGHLFRGDRGVVMYAQATSDSVLPTAAELLTQLMEHAVVN